MINSNGGGGGVGAGLPYKEGEKQTGFEISILFHTHKIKFKNFNLKNNNKKNNKKLMGIDIYESFIFIFDAPTRK